MTQFAAKTHPGNRPGENQDAIGWSTDHGLWLIADGMGGHSDGALASRLVKETILDHAGDEPLSSAVLAAHDAVRQAAGDTTGQDRMGSTVVCARFAGPKCQLAWVGDSRGYLWRRARLSLLTRDHTYVEVLRQMEGLSETQLRAHPRANVVIQTLGIGDPVPSELAVDVYDRDWVLLCSDGLTAELSDAQIAEVVKNSANPEEAVESLVSSALQRGGKDNVSVVIVQAQGRRFGRLAGWLAGLDDRKVTLLAIVSGALLAALTTIAVLRIVR